MKLENVATVTLLICAGAVLGVLIALSFGPHVRESSKYNAISCDKYGCDVLTQFKNEVECTDFLYSIISLHNNYIKDAKNRTLRCVEQ